MEKEYMIWWGDSTNDYMDYGPYTIDEAKEELQKLRDGDAKFGHAMIVKRISW